MNAQGKDADELARAVISRTGLLSSIISDTTPESISKQENLQEVLNGVKSFVTDRIEEGDNEHIGIADFLAEVSLATDQDMSDDQPMDRVTLMTAHAAKGLEFNNVFVVGVEEELFPSQMSMDSPQQIEEERRLLYVAITRARKFCMLSYAKSRFRNGQTCVCRPSRFLRDIDRATLRPATGTELPGQSFRPQVQPMRTARPSYTSEPQNSRSVSTPGQCGVHSASELAEGMRIRHERFGRGTITSIETGNPSMGDRIKVDFENAPSKTLLLSYAKFEILDRKQ